MFHGRFCALFGAKPFGRKVEKRGHGVGRGEANRGKALAKVAASRCGRRVAGVAIGKTASKRDGKAYSLRK